LGAYVDSAGLHLLHVLHDLLLDLGHLLGGAELEILRSGLGPLEVPGRHVEGIAGLEDLIAAIGG
jgi:hypothetical protein